MGLGGKAFLAGAVSALMAAGMAFMGYAGTVGSLSITVKDSETAGEMAAPDIRISPSGCELAELTWSKEVEDWKPGKSVSGYLTITSDGGKDFEESYLKSRCSVSGAEFKRASRDQEDSSLLHVTISYTPVLRLGMTEEAGWSDLNKTRAKWKKVPYASAYEVRLYRNDTWVKTLEVTAISVDISPYMNEAGDYSYAVRAKAKTAEEKKYLLTGEYVQSEDVLTADSEEIGAVGGRWKNYQEGRSYQAEDGTIPSSRWMMILGKWYYFDESGYAVTGWFRDPASGLWYYLDGQGEMQYGWLELAGNWYYLKADGAMATGWIEDKPGQWYYLNPDGTMAVNTVIDGRTVGSDGKAQ